MAKKEMSPRMKELMLQMIKSGDVPDDDEPRKKPGKKRPGRPVGTNKAISGKSSKSAEQLLAENIRVKKTWTACSYIWVLERPFMDDTGCVRWEFLSACVGENAKFAHEFITPQCRKRKVVVYGVPLPEDNLPGETPITKEAEKDAEKEPEQLQLGINSPAS